ncbi:uncharacterized protein LOC111623456 [Centruroides sculpturatus]|uniref:uncharacterized protein LOC111623456 n=1 Tax=Centruroides sculpturatus TaxID=218467 RepID=UPI000C6EAD20|nr:uncharacterized protein LOC111623456 [Centruroides sculpturatus]
MFSSRANPSPTRSSIKEANDHLQLLHQRVVELETTVQDQAEALIKKDEMMQSKLRELAEIKDLEIDELTKRIEYSDEKLKKLEHLLREKDQLIEQLSNRCVLAEEVSAYTPAIEKLLAAMRKLPSKNLQGKHIKVKRSMIRNHKSEKKPNFIDGSLHSDGNMGTDGHLQPPSQSFADMRIARSFNINSNFSMSEEEDNEMM